VSGLGCNEWKEVWDRAVLAETEVLGTNTGYYEGQPRWWLLLYLTAVHCFADGTDRDLTVK
jgi:hypothetical protein